MVFFNYATKQLAAKIVYYGPGLSGKTTNLQVIYRRTHPKSRGELISLETGADRTLFFDLLPLEVGRIKGFNVRFQLYTVPGQVHYNETRKLVLKGVDGIVFVADSQETLLESNLESLENLAENLAFYNLKIDDIPMVIQYNKRDLPNILPVAELEKKLNRLEVPSFEAVAIRGIGVFETLKGISKLTLAIIAKKLEEQEETKRKIAHISAERQSPRETAFQEDETSKTKTLPKKGKKEEPEQPGKKETEVKIEKKEYENAKQQNKGEASIHPQEKGIEEATTIIMKPEEIKKAEIKKPEPHKEEPPQETGIEEESTVIIKPEEKKQEAEKGNIQVEFNVENKEIEESEKVYFRRIKVSRDEADKQLDELINSILGATKKKKKKSGDLERKTYDEVFREILRHEKVIKNEEQIEISQNELENSRYIIVKLKPEKGKKEREFKIPINEKNYNIITLRLIIKFLVNK